jgi:hypothetical protein
VFTHNLVELCTAIKAIYLDQLLARPDVARVLFFDADVLVLRDLGPLLAEFRTASVFLRRIR